MKKFLSMLFAVTLIVATSAIRCSRSPTYRIVSGYSDVSQR